MSKLRLAVDEDAGSGGQALAWYRLYGFTVGSDVPLPLAPIPRATGAAPAWIFRRGELGQAAYAPDAPPVATLRGPDGTVLAAVHRELGGISIWDRGIGLLRVSPDATRVDVYPEAEADERVVGLALVGQVSIYLLHRLGYPTLHASAVVAEDGAVAFLGPHGQGKSTLAAWFLRQGAALLTDDALPLRLVDGHVHGGPGLPLMKVWPETVDCALELAVELPDLLANYPKKLLALDGHFRVAQEPARLRALYVVDPYDPTATGRSDVAARQLSPRESFAVLLAQTSWRSLLQPAEAARLVPLYTHLVAQAPVVVLSLPRGFEHLEAVHRRVVEDLRTR